MCFMTSAAAPSPIDSMTTADFSTSLSCARLLKAVSVTGYPSPDYLSSPRRVMRDERLHGVGLDAENVLLPPPHSRRSLRGPSRSRCPEPRAFICRRPD